MENPLSQNLLFLVMADISAIGRQRVKEKGKEDATSQVNLYKAKKKME